MKILCHRGDWRSTAEKNSLAALRRSIKRGFGFESDVRDYRGALVISHDIADDKSPALEDVFKILREANDQVCFAINIKSDGIASMLRDRLREFGLKNYFAFDMSVPQMLWYRTLGLRFFTRQSEFEPSPALYEDAAGVWLDAFESDEWLTPELILEHLSKGKEVCIVSPELHDRKPQSMWARLKLIGDRNFFLCTDMPTDAARFFGGETH